MLKIILNFSKKTKFLTYIYVIYRLLKKLNTGINFKLTFIASHKEVESINEKTIINKSTS